MIAVLEKWKETIFYQSVSLAISCGVAAILLAIIQFYTTPIIARRIAEDQDALLFQVLAGQSFANRVFDDEREVEFEGRVYQIFQAKNAQDEVLYYVIRGEQEGYSGVIRFLIGVDTLGAIQGVRVLSHTETPGLGDKIEIEKSQWVLGFNARSLDNTPKWAVKKDGGDFDQFTGATITPRSMVKGVHNALLALNTLLKSGNEVPKGENKESQNASFHRE